ncbi:MAG: cytochrome C oxidase subunit I [Gammaproteobacteria bacterium]|nr:MAG: cytochrome C oxidase subunit I [Gammaproteobacteria bacterium]
MSDNNFRTCPDTGLLLHKPALRLIQANAVAAVVFLLVGGFMGLGVGLTRWPEVHLLGAQDFYTALTGHGINVLIFWIIFFEVAVLYFASSAVLRCRLAAPKIGWLAFALMIIGAVMNNYAVWALNSAVMMTSYAPMPAHWSFYLGLILFAVGALIGCFLFLGTLVIAKKEKTYEGSLPLVTFGALTACIIAVFTIASGALILLPTFFWQLGLISNIDAGVYRLIWWAFGHSSQQINVATHITIWYLVASIMFGAKPLSEKVSRFAFLLYIAVLQIASAHHLLVDPGVSAEWKMFNTSYAMYLAVMASMVHGVTVPGAMEAAQRARGFNNGLFEWLRKAPWGNPTFSSIIMSIFGFGFLGGITGVMMGTEQLNLLIHNTVYVPGHFHATVVLGTTMTFMGLTYWLVPILFRRELILMPLCKIQPYIFALGMTGVSMFMMGAGTMGVSRRHWDVSFTDATYPYEYASSALSMMSLNGLSVVVAVVGGAMFCLLIVGALLFGKKLGEDEKSSGFMIADPVTDEQYHALHASTNNAIPGTFSLAMIFLTTFALYYFINWKYLAETWGLS